ncbi:hypothetical protein D3C74_432640 [compost metagenome]
MNTHHMVYMSANLIRVTSEFFQLVSVQDKQYNLFRACSFVIHSTSNHSFDFQIRTFLCNAFNIIGIIVGAVNDDDVLGSPRKHQMIMD